MKIDLWLMEIERVRLIQEAKFWSDFAFFWSATILQPLIKNDVPEAYNMKTGLFLVTYLVSVDWRNPGKPYRLPESYYCRAEKCIYVN